MSQILGHPRWRTMPLAFCAGRQPARKWEKAESSNLTQRDKPSGEGARPGPDCLWRDDLSHDFGSSGPCSLAAGMPLVAKLFEGWERAECQILQAKSLAPGITSTKLLVKWLK
jgi:hypothetical protein